MSRTGRRPGTPATRATILDAARRSFGARGYQATTFRLVAEEAAVDPALVVHYFGSKENLFVAALEFPIRPSEIFGSLTQMDPAQAAHRVVHTFLGVLRADTSRDAFLALTRSAVADEAVALMLREFLTDELLGLVAAVSRRPDARLRASLVAAQLVGFAFVRHIARIDAAVEAGDEDVAALLAPVVEAYLR
jgi:AcrR family transcriptional regulator